MRKGMLRLSMRLSNRNLLIKMVISYVLTGAILLSLLTVLLYNQFTKSNIREIENISQQMLAQAHTMTDTFWLSNFGYMYQEYISDKLLSKGMLSSSFDDTEYGPISQKLSQIANTSSFIQSIYLYNHAASLVFSNVTSAVDAPAFFDLAFIDSLKSYPIDASPLLINRTAPLNGTSGKQVNVLSLAFRQLSKDGILAAMVYNLDQQFLQSIVASAGANDANTIFIIDQYGTMISHPELPLVNRPIIEQAYIARLLAYPQEEGSFVDTVDGRKSLVVYKKWERLGWVFVSVSDYRRLLQDANQIRTELIIASGACILLSILAALLFTGNIYRPIGKLMRTIKTEAFSPQVQARNELDYISHTYSEMKSHLDKLSVLASSREKELQKAVLNQLLHGELSRPAALAEAMEKLRLSSVRHGLQAIVLKLDHFHSMKQSLSQEHTRLYRFAVSNIAEELIQSSYPAAVSESGEDHVSILVQADPAEAEHPQRLREAVSRVQRSVDRYMKLSVSVGIGGIAQQPGGIRASYSQALAAANYRIVYGCGAIITYAELPDQAPYDYPLAMEKKIMEQLRAGEQAQLEAEMDRFIAHISRFAYDEIMLSLTQLALITVRICNDINAKDSANAHASNATAAQIDLDFNAIYNIIRQYDTLDQIRAWFLDIFRQVMQAAQRARDDKHSELANRMIDYIKLNYSDANLSVESVSAYVGLSPNYIRTIFKGRTGQSISSFINETRIATAKALLLESDRPANKIAEEAGFSNSTYFYTLFKKMAGQTPDEFRKQFKQNEA